jgi:hypothetical protein
LAYLGRFVLGSVDISNLPGYDPHLTSKKSLTQLNSQWLRPLFLVRSRIYPSL